MVEMCGKGSAGRANSNVHGLKSDPIVQVQAPAKIVNSYKYFVRENSNGGISADSWTKFLHELEQNPGVFDLYDVLALVDELYNLERQYYALKKTSFLPYYSSFLDRIVQYANKGGKYGLTRSDRKVLGYVYTTALSKICTIKNNPAADLVVKLNDYLDSAEKHVEKLKESKNIEASYDRLKSYNSSMERYVKEAEEFIDGQVSSDLDNTFDGMNQQVELLFIEVTALENRTREEIEKLAEKKKELQNSMVLRGVLEAVKLVSTFLSFTGDVGKAVGDVIGKTASITGSIALGDGDSDDVDEVSKLPAGVNAGAARLKAELEREQYLLKEQLIDVNRVLQDFLSRQSSPAVKEVTDKVAETQKELEALMQKGDTFDSAARQVIQDRRKELQDLMRKKIKEAAGSKVSVVVFASVDPPKNDSTDPVKNKTNTVEYALGNATNFLTFVDASKKFYDQMRKDQDKINKIAAAIEEESDHLNQLTQYKEDIYNILLPACKDIEDSINDAVKNFKDKSHSFLDVGKWQVQRTIRKMKTMVKKMTSGFKVQEDFVEQIDRLEEGMNVIIGLYDRIQDYHDKSELADYIHDVNSPNALGIQVYNAEMQTAINNLQSTILSNLVIQEYDSAFKAFKQYVFPFANIFLSNYSMPSVLQANDLDGFMRDAVRKLGEMKEKVDHSLQAVPEYKGQIVEGRCFNSKSRVMTPFYVWKHAEIKRNLPHLLQGKPVAMKADVLRGIDQNAVKFNTVGLRLVLLNTTRQREFDETFSFFQVFMNHTGNSYYRCAKRVYVISHPRQDIYFSMSKRPNGELDADNLVYRDLKENIPILSPYAMWNIQLSTKKSSFSALEKFINEPMNIELEGTGQYVETSSVCNEDLDKYYTLVKTVPKLNTMMSIRPQSANDPYVVDC